MLKLNKKGFTIVELVIVIAVVAILAAVLIPTFIGLMQTAKTSADIQLVTSLNKVMAMQEALDGKNGTMYNALQDAKANGYDLSKLTPTSEGNDIVWDQSTDRFALVNPADETADNILFWDESQDKPSVDDENIHKLWKIYTEMPDTQTYSIYWAGTSAPESLSTLTVGFDAGECSGIAELKYVQNERAQTVVFRTNGGKLTVDAKNDTVSHYNNAAEVYITAVAKDSYHEYGTTEILTIESGHLKMEANGLIRSLVAAPASANAVKVTAEANQILMVSGKGEHADSVVKAVKNTGAANADYIEAADANAFNDGKRFQYGFLQSSAHVVLTNNVDLGSAITLGISNTTLFLDLNGHKLTLSQFAVKSAAHVVISDSKGTGKIQFTGQYGIYITFTGASVVLNGGTLYASSTYPVYSFTEDKTGSVVMLASTDTSFVMNGGKIVANNDHSDVPAGSIAVRMFSTDTTFIMNGGEIEKTVGTLAAIQASGSGETTGTKIEINGGSIKSNTVAIYHPLNGSLTVNGGSIEGTTALYIKSGKIELNGGTIKGTGDKSDYKFNGNGCNPTGDAVVIDACGYPGADPVVKITGGTYTAMAAGAHGIAHYKYDDHKANITNPAGIDVHEEEIAKQN